jgi:hypothetical protein
MFAAALSRMAAYAVQSLRQDAAQAAQHGRCAFEGARLRLWWLARPAQAEKLTSSFDCEWLVVTVVLHRPLCDEIPVTASPLVTWKQSDGWSEKTGEVVWGQLAAFVSGTKSGM